MIIMNQDKKHYDLNFNVVHTQEFNTSEFVRFNRINKSSAKLQVNI